MCIPVWGVKVKIVDPEKGHGYGWKAPFWLARNPRTALPMSAPLAEYYTWTEVYVGAVPWNLKAWPKARGTKGLGRLGADFFPVLASAAKRDRSKWSYTILGRYPETSWGQLNIGRGTYHLLGRGRNGPVPSAISEAVRENIQVIETRIYIEKALLDEAKRTKLGADLAKRCREALDERIRMCNRGLSGAPGGSGQGSTAWLWLASSGWEERAEELFQLAAEVARKLAE